MTKRIVSDESKTLRGILMNYPHSTVEETLNKCRLEGYHRIDKQKVYATKSFLKKRWGLNELTDLQFNQKGELILSHLLRKYIEQHPDATEKDAVEYFQADDITLRKGFFYNIKAKMEKPKVKKEKKEKPDIDDLTALLLEENSGTGKTNSTPVESDAILTLRFAKEFVTMFKSPKEAIQYLNELFG